MKKYAIKLEVTNSVNDSRRIEWFFYNTEKEKEVWVAEKDEEADKWNYHTAGAMSTRFYNYNYYEIEKLLEYSIDELEGMKLKDVLEIIKSNL